MRNRETVTVLIIFILLSLFLGAQTEIVSHPSDHDDAFYVRKSLSPFGTWSDLATIKEVASPIFFLIVRQTHIPLRMAFGLGYAFALFLVWRELRRWPFPPWLCLAATFLPMFMPAQYMVFQRATADPFAVILSACLFASCMAIYRGNASWISTVAAGGIASVIWLNRPEGILGIVPVIFTLLLLKVRKLPAGPFPCWRGLTLRIGTVVGILGATALCIDALNRAYYGLPSPTIMRAAPFVHAWDLLSEIDDGEPPLPSRPVSKKALELAFKNSPAMALSRQFWENSTDGRGWSSSNFPGYSPADGSVDGGHFQFALQNSGAAIAGPNPANELVYFQQISNELKSAMRRGALPHRPVLSNSLGPSFSIFTNRFWHSAGAIGSLIFNGQGRIDEPGDTASAEQNRLFDFACSRRDGLLTAGRGSIHVRGWMTVRDTPDIVDSILLEGMPQNSVLHVGNRPDVPRVLFGKSINPANCGFDLKTSAGGVEKAVLAVSVNGRIERLPVKDLIINPGSEIIRGDVRVHVDNTDRAVTPYQPPLRNWVVMDRIGRRFSGLMPGVAYLSVLALSVCIFYSRRNIGSHGIWNALLAFTLIAASIVLPRWFLLTAIDANRFPGGEARMRMPATVVAWVWEAVVIGTAVTLALRKPPKKTTGQVIPAEIIEV